MAQWSSIQKWLKMNTNFLQYSYQKVFFKLLNTSRFKKIHNISLYTMYRQHQLVHVVTHNTNTKAHNINQMLNYISLLLVLNILFARITCVWTVIINCTRRWMIAVFSGVDCIFKSISSALLLLKRITCVTFCQFWFIVDYQNWKQVVSNDTIHFAVWSISASIQWFVVLCQSYLLKRSDSSPARAGLWACWTSMTRAPAQTYSRSTALDVTQQLVMPTSNLTTPTSTACSIRVGGQGWTAKSVLPPR